MSERIGRAVDAVIDAAIDAGRIGGAVVLVARDGALVHRRAAGWADRTAAVPMREDAIFLLASVTKPLVTAAAMRLVEAGRLSLDQPITDLLPAFRPRLPDGTTPDITIRQLLTHTSGLGYRFMEPPESDYHRLNVSDGLDQPELSLDENLDRLAAARLAFAPGSAWRYSLGIDVVGAAIARATGESLPALVARLVTRPLGLADTAFHVVDPSRLARPQVDATPWPVPMTDGMVLQPPEGGALTFVPSRIFAAGAYPSGGGGMAGTAGDIMTFLETIRRGGAPILAGGTVAAMLQDHAGPAAETQGPGWGFGLGWAVLVDPAGTGTPQAAGTIQWGGVYGHTWFVDPANRLSVVACTNTVFEGVMGAFPTEIRDAVYT